MYDGKVVFKVDLDTKDFTPQLQKTKKDLDSLMYKYDALKKKPVMDRTDKKNLEGYTEEARAKVIASANAQRKKDLLDLQAQIQQTANKYIDLKAKQDAVFNASYKKGLSSIKNINMMDNAAYNKSYALQYGQIGNTMTKLSGELPYVADGFKDIGKEADYAGNEAEDAGKKTEKSGNNMSKGFTKGLKSAKRLALGIVGIRSAYMLARKAASSYMAQDEDLAKSMQSVWTGLGAFLAPLLETLTNLMLKFVGYLNVFIRALTGKDLIANANAKILEKQAKAQEKLNKATKEYQNYDFDVIRTQQADTSASSGSGSDEAQLINIPELNQGIVKKLEDLAEWLKKNKDLIEKVGIALGVTFGAVAIGKLLANIAALIGSGALMTGLLGLLAVLALVAVAWEIKLVIEGLEELKEASKTAKNLAEYLSTIAKLTGKNIVENPDELEPETLEEVTDKYQDVNEGIIDYYDSVKDSVEQTKKGMERMSYGNEGELGAGLGRFFADTGAFLTGKGTNYTMRQMEEVLEQNEGEYKAASETMQSVIWSAIELAKQNRLSEKGYKTLTKIIMKYSGDLDYLSDVTDEYKFNVKDAYNILGNYAEVYPDVISEVLGFNNVTKDQKTQINDLTKKLANGQISFTKYTTEINKIPNKVTTKVETSGIDKSKKDVTDYTETIDKVPKEKSTKLSSDDKNAKDSVNNYKRSLLEIPSIITTKVQFSFNETTIQEQIKQLLKKINVPNLGSSLGKLLGFAGGGYVSQPTLAMVGEGKYNEYVIPEGEDYISRLANEIGKYSSGGNGNVNVYLDGRLIQRQISKTSDRINFTRNGR